MPNRILKESICTSESIEQLSAFEEIFFYRLIVNCDDFGLMDARPAILKARLFPLKQIRDTQIIDALRRLTSLELITPYTVDGKSFLMMNAWDRHQQIRAKKAKFPLPPENMMLADGTRVRRQHTDPDDTNGNHLISDDIRSNQTHADVPVIQSNTIQSENESESENESKYTRARERFDQFWEAYPKKVGKGAAQKSFEKLRVTDELLQTMLTVIERMKRTPQWTKDNGQYIPNPQTWLNQRRWEDEVPVQQSQRPLNPYLDFINGGELT